MKVDKAIYLQFELEMWKNWHESFMEHAKDYCLIFYHEVKLDVIKAIKPCIQYLGFDIPADLEKCILKNQEGHYHRKSTSQEEKEEIYSKFPKRDIKLAKKYKKQIFAELKKHSVNAD